MEYDYKDKIRWFKFACLLFSRRFRIRLRDTIYYALNHFEEKRGTGASDVLLFKIYHVSQIMKEEK